MKTTRDQLVLTNCMFSMLIMVYYLYFVYNPTQTTFTVILILGFLVLLKIKFSYFKPMTAFILPWLVVGFIVLLPVSEYHRPINKLTLILISLPIVIPIVLWPISYPSSIERKERHLMTKVFGTRFLLVFLTIIIVFMVNTLLSGFIPLIKGITTGNTNYLKYGVGGLNGFLYSMLNAFGLVSFYIFLIRKRKIYLAFYIATYVVFFLTFSRQNMVSLLCESVILFTLVNRQIKRGKLAIISIAFLLIFSYLGTYRTGSIKALAKIKEEYSSIPSPFVWIYSYGYFNILNLDRVVSGGHYGYYNGASLNQLVPSFIRPNSISDFVQLEVPNFTVKSYITPILRDFGIIGILIFTCFLVLLTMIRFKAAVSKKDFESVAIYSILYFCAFFSFFSNFWFFLPIIFQIPFVMLFSRFLIKENWGRP